MLRVTPSAWTYTRATVEDESGFLTRLKTSSWKESATFELGGRSHTIRRTGWPAIFTLRQDHVEIASARKLGWFTSRIELMVNGVSYELKLRSLFSSAYELLQRGETVGSVRGTSWWNRRAEADLPDDLPPEVQVFTIWVVLAMWRRAESSG
ncbi:MAG: hypothetical protein AAF726_11270 [Planctomycetota bacterium]